MSVELQNRVKEDQFLYNIMTMVVVTEGLGGLELLPPAQETSLSHVTLQHVMRLPEYFNKILQRCVWKGSARVKRTVQKSIKRTKGSVE